MPIKDLHVLPKVKDSQTFVYAEHCKIDRDEKSISLHDADGKTQVPCSNLTTLLVGPGTSITHAAFRR
jgi:CRISP-associated protein Cas1